MKTRLVSHVLTLAFLAAPLAVQAQPQPKVPRIGFLAVGTREGRAFLIEGFLRGLGERGYVVGQNLVIEYRFSEGRNERLPELAAELVALNVDVILASGSPASFAAKRATRTIPIVMGSLAADPVETGLIASLARPGGNITGMTEMAAQLGGKRLELLKETVPGLSRVAVFWNPLNPAYGPILKELEAAAPALGVELRRVEVQVPEDFDAAFQGAIRQRAGALIVPGDPLVTNRPRTVTDLALILVDSYRRAASHVDKILKGARPGDLPMEQPTKFDLFVNLKTAKALGLTIPPAVLARADEVIQ